MNTKNLLAGAVVVIVGMLIYNVAVRPLLAKANISA